MSRAAPAIWGAKLSQPTRAVLWTAMLSRVDVDFRPIDTSQGDHLSKEFLKLNPNKKFPVLKDGDFVLHESHAMMKYIVEKYADAETRERLYPPSDLEARARIDVWLDWKHTFLRPGACGVVRRRIMQFLMKDPSKHSMVWDLKEIPAEREERIYVNSLVVMEDQLAETSFIAGTPHASLADIALFEELAQLDMLPQQVPPPKGSNFGESYPNVYAWMQRLRALDFYKEAHSGLERAVEKVGEMRTQGKL